MPKQTDLPNPIGSKTGWPWTVEPTSLPPTMPDGTPWPKISIVTPSFNQGQYLEETIRSVLLQGYPNLEYIIIDGGSTDNSVEIIKKYEPWLAYWVSEPDRGQSHAINKGWQHSTGEILSWLNSDDYLLQNALIEVANAFREYPNAGIIHGNAININYSGDKTGHISGEPLILETSLIQLSDSIAQPAAFISKRALLQIGYIDENLHVSMDWDLWIRIAVIFPTHYFNLSWAVFRVWEGSKGSTIGNRSYQEKLITLMKIFGTNSIKIPLNVKRRSLAAGYGRSAFYSNQIGNKAIFRYHLFLSLLICPKLKGGKARRLIPEMFLGRSTVKLLIAIRNRFHQTIHN